MDKSTINTVKAKKPKRTIPPPGRKLSVREAMDYANKKFAKAFQKLAK